MFRWLADENLHRPIVTAVLRLQPAMDVMLAQNVQEVAGKPDPDVLAWAAAQGRIVVTHDADTMPKHARQRIAKGLAMPGLLLIRYGTPVKTAADQWLTMEQASFPEEWPGQIRFLPWH